MTTVSLPNEISALFTDAHDNFPAIIGKSSNNDVQRLHRRNFVALQKIDLGEGTDGTGLILSKVYHKVVSANQVFDRADEALEAYEPSIRDNDNKAICLRQEKKCSCKLDRQADIQTAERVEKKFVLSRVEETWVVCLQNETTLFKYVTLCNLLEHLGATSTVGEVINVIGLQQGILSWWVEDPRFPEFITRCEEAQQKARQSGLSISDAWIFAVASRSLLAKKSSLTNDLSLKGYNDSNRLGKSVTPTSKTRRRRLSVSSDTQTPPQIP